MRYFKHIWNVVHRPPRYSARQHYRHLALGSFCVEGILFDKLTVTRGLLVV